MSKNKRKRWSPAEKQRLKRLVSERKTAEDIAYILGKTHKSVSTQKERLGISKPMMLSPKNPLHLAEVIKFKMSGWNLKEIAKVYGCSIKKVSRMLTANGMSGFMPSSRTPENPRCTWSEFELNRLRRYCKKKYSFDRICSYFPNRSRLAISVRIYKMTRYWFTPEQQKARRLAKEREWEWRVW